MRRPSLITLLCLTGLTWPVHAEDVATAIHNDHWDAAMAAAADYPDPVARKLVTYYRLLAPNTGTTAELDAFIAASPDWPQQELLTRRRDEALSREADDATAAEFCVRDSPAAPSALARCAAAFTRLGQTARAEDAARRAWITGFANPASETAFMQRWGAMIRPEDQYRRFDTLAWNDPLSAARQILRLDAAQKSAAEARLALRRDDANALPLLATLPAAARNAPGLFLEHVRTLRRAGLDSDALALWRDSGEAAERATDADHLPAFWSERNLLARRRLRAGDAAGAYALAAGHAQHAPGQVADAEFLAGFIALRFLKDPAAARRHFAVLPTVSKAAITQARAHYWLARAAADSAAAQQEFAAAAAYPTTYYGQLAILAGHSNAELDTRLAALHDPAWTDPQALDFAGREVTRAASVLVAWGEKRRAHAFLLQLEDLAPDDAHRALAARLASGFAMPDIAVAIARRAGRDGVMLPQSGWPIPFSVPDGPVPPAAALGIIRQESSFDTAVVSPAGARGLMQLMPATAAELAKATGQTPTLQSLTADPAQNILLGTTYLRGLLDKFANQLPLAIAAYNAGPGRVIEWLSENGDPRTGAVDMIDWIELIPFDETRNYVQRVSENIVMYTARRRDPGPLAMAE